MRKCIILLLNLALPAVTYAAPCSDPELADYQATHPMCRFYTGTRFYREKRYAAAFTQWQAILNDRHIPKEFDYLRLDALNNVGFLYYRGWGVVRNQNLAINAYWRPAEQAGHDEAAYHLCHAYADEKSPLALGYCREALRRYQYNRSEDNEIIGMLRDYITNLEQR